MSAGAFVGALFGGGGGESSELAAPPTVTKDRHAGRGTDPLDHLRISCSEGNVVASSIAKAALDYAKQELAERDAVIRRLEATLARRQDVEAQPCGS